MYALLYGPSICGAYRFVMQRGKGVVMDVEAALFMRSEVQRFGLAPISSMYWFSEQVKKTAVDWRPRSMTPMDWRSGPERVSVYGDR